jgi:uncharacterized protein
VHESSAMRPVGRVVGVWRYPVKSMGAEALNQTEIAWFGLPGDRRWAFIRDDAGASGFPWYTLRDRPDMAQFRPCFVEPDRPDRSQTVVRTPAGVVFEITDPALGQALCPPGLRVIRHDRGIFDTFPLSIISTQTLGHLGGQLGLELKVERFRPNLLVEATGTAPFQEDGWVGSVLRIGSARVRVDKRDGRCVVITIDPLSGERQPSILKTVAAERQGCLGVYASTVDPGRVALGDTVVLEPAARR